MIKDSGDRTQFDTGAVRDMHAGKGRMDLLPLSALIELSKHCEEGALKYGEHNVDKGIPQHSLCDSAIRHLVKYMRGGHGRAPSEGGRLESYVGAEPDSGASGIGRCAVEKRL